MSSVRPPHAAARRLRPAAVPLLLLGAWSAASVETATAAVEPAVAPQEGGSAPRAQDPEVAARLNWLEERRAGDEAARREIVTRFAKAPGWRLVPCDRYFLATNSEREGFLDGTRRHLNAVRARLVREWPPRTPIGGPNVHSRLLVVALNDDASYHEYGGPGGTLAIYSEPRRELVLHDEENASDGARVDWTGLQSMAAVAYLSELERDVPGRLPEWLVQGTGTIYEELTLGEDGRLTTRIAERRAEEFAEAFRHGELLSVADLMSSDRKRFQNDRRGGRQRSDLNRYQAGVFLRFLESEGRGSFAWDPRWGQIVPRYVDALQRGLTTEACRDHALEGVELRDLDLGWRLWLEQRLRGEMALPK